MPKKDKQPTPRSNKIYQPDLNGKFKVVSKRDLNDLILERLRSLDHIDALRALKKMFPNKEKDIYALEHGDTMLIVGDVKIKVKNDRDD